MDKDSVRRVDNRPASVYSIIIFAFVFTMCYIFYPQISMFVPFLGERITKSTNYEQCAIENMLDAKYILVARVDSVGKAQLENTGNNGEVFRNAEFSVTDTVKGETDGSFTLRLWGGSVLVRQGAKTRKYTVTYTDAAELEKGKEYLLFIDDSLDIINGKYGALEKNKNGRFTDFTGKEYSENDIRELIKTEVDG